MAATSAGDLFSMVAMSSMGSRALSSRIFKSCSIVVYSFLSLYTESHRKALFAGPYGKLNISIAQALPECTPFFA